jgi:hypothetical protein
MTVVKELYKSDSVGVQEVGENRGGTEQGGEYKAFFRKGNENHELGTSFCVYKTILTTVKRVESANERISCIMLRVLLELYCSELSCPKG